MNKKSDDRSLLLKAAESWAKIALPKSSPMDCSKCSLDNWTGAHRLNYNHSIPIPLNLSVHRKASNVFSLMKHLLMRLVHLSSKLQELLSQASVFIFLCLDDLWKPSDIHAWQRRGGVVKFQVHESLWPPQKTWPKHSASLPGLVPSTTARIRVMSGCTWILRAA